jgi:predicted metalloprotease
MKWRDMRPSGNVEDRRMSGGGGGFRMGGGMGFPGMRGGMRGGGLGLGGLVVLLILGYLMGGNPLSLLDGGGAMPYDSAPAPTGTPNDDAGQFVDRVLGDTEDTFADLFSRVGRQYVKPTLVLFRDEVGSACGSASAAVGPFYCPGDRKVYIDLGFFQELDRRFGAPGDFAQAYVIAHEVGHHVQNSLGFLQGGGGNQQSVRQELQADCLAGLWGRSAASRGHLEAGDVEEGLRAAAAIGDDTLQRKSQGRVVPESFTHGSSEQRVAAFRQGMNGSSLATCGIQ